MASVNSYRVSLNAKILVGSLLLGILTAAIGVLAIAMSRVMERSSRAILADNVSSLKAAEELEISLLDQKGLVSSYLLDGQGQWLQVLEQKRQKFTEWFGRAQEVALTPSEQAILQRIGRLYQEYDRSRMHVIGLVQQDNRPLAQQLLLGGMKQLLDQLYDACEELLLINEQLITESLRRSQRTFAQLQKVLWGCIAVAIGLGLFGGWLASRAMMRRLVRSEKLATLGEMAGLVAHEIRNPLTAIKMRVHSLEEEPAASASSQDDVAVIRHEIDRLERIVQNFLDLAKLPSPRFQAVAVDAAIHRVAALLRPTLEERAVQVRVHLPEQAPAVYADAEQVEQVLLNLALNALQAMPTGGVLSFSVEKTSLRGEEAEAVEITVGDTGPGIPKALEERIFDPFFTTKTNGVGLGLSLAKKIVQSHRGSLRLARSDGEGAAVAVRLPLALPEAAVRAG